MSVVSPFMRLFSVIILGYCAAVNANPRVLNQSDLKKGIYIASEHLSVTVTSSNAQVRGTFTFSSGLPRKQLAKGLSVRLLLPIWFPEKNTNDSSVAWFWNSFAKGTRNKITDRERRVLEDVLGLQIEIGQQVVSVEELAVLKAGSSKPTGNAEWGAFQFIQEAGFCCLVFELTHSSDFVRSEIPLTISYHAPLSSDRADVAFVYTPVFDPIPKGISTMNTNRYAVTVGAGPDCSLTWSSGSKKETIDSGKCITFAPKGWQPFRVAVNSRANLRSALDARTRLCFHFERQWPGVSESERYAIEDPVRHEP
jgi:hypothetical protein